MTRPQSAMDAALDALISMSTGFASEEAINTTRLLQDIRGHLARYPESAATLLLGIARAQQDFRAAVRKENDTRLYNAFSFAVHLPRDPRHWTAKTHGVSCLRVVEALDLKDGGTDHWQDIAARIAAEYTASRKAPESTT